MIVERLDEEEEGGGRGGGGWILRLRFKCEFGG
jgi:hypothetical protein